ncbi:MAG: indole-3-glycerol phosphate synthase TrpC [Chloroflexi bacterium]|nr:indole-3-glycerol phosphate synthase TrpC [Chloroflexota bacterium]
MASILDRIVAAKREEVARSKAQVPLAVLKGRVAAMPSPLNFSGALMGDAVRLIAEVKKASPSRGLLRPNFDPVELALAYAGGGAAAISVLTDSHFQGTGEHLIAVAAAVRPLNVPVLRKDFHLDPYQLYEARAWGADAALLIAAILPQTLLMELLALARTLWLQCLVEVHNEEELERALRAGAEVIGINNRDLRTFHTDLGVTERLAPRVPRGVIAVSESGILTREDVLRVRKAGAHAILVGEALVTAADPSTKVQELLALTNPH